MVRPRVANQDRRNRGVAGILLGGAVIGAGIWLFNVFRGEGAAARLIYPIFVDQGAINLTSVFDSCVNPEVDSAMLVSGNRAEVLRVEDINRWSGEVAARFPQMHQMVMTGSDPDKLQAVLDGTNIQWVGISYDPEQTFFFNDPVQTTDYITEQAEIVGQAGRKFFVHPAGEAVTGEGLVRQDYGELSRFMDEMIVEFQSFCKNGTFGEALETLINDFRNARSRTPLGVKLTVGLGPTLPNGVSAAQGLACYNLSLGTNVSILTWYGTSVPQEFFTLIQEIRGCTVA